MELKITASMNEEFLEIEEALKTIEKDSKFLENFKSVHREIDEESLEKIIVMNFDKEIKYDRNHKKYSLIIPDNLILEKVEVERRFVPLSGNAKKPIYDTIIVGKVEDNDHLFRITFPGMDDNLFKIVRESQCKK